MRIICINFVEENRIDETEEYTVKKSSVGFISNSRKGNEP